MDYIMDAWLAGAFLRVLTVYLPKYFLKNHADTEGNHLRLSSHSASGTSTKHTCQAAKFEQI
jgi:hypothetical protein